MRCLYFYNKTNASFEDDCFLKLPACQVLHHFSLRFVTTWKLISIVSGESWALLTASGQLRAILPLCRSFPYDRTAWTSLSKSKMVCSCNPSPQKVEARRSKPEASLTQLIPESPSQPVSWFSGFVPALHRLAHCSFIGSLGQARRSLQLSVSMLLRPL